MEMERVIVELAGRQVVLDLPASFENHRVEIIARTLDDEPPSTRGPHPSIAGKVKTHGDIFDSVPEGDWELP
jgi:hypothetical protein